MTPTPTRTDRLQGNLDLLILRALLHEPMHGWAVAQRLEAISRSVLQVGQGSIYPALRRLEDEGWIAAEWGVSEAGRSRGAGLRSSLARAGRSCRGLGGSGA